MTPICQQHYDRVCKAHAESGRTYYAAIQTAKQAWADYDAARQLSKFTADCASYSTAHGKGRAVQIEQAIKRISTAWQDYDAAKQNKDMDVKQHQQLHQIARGKTVMSKTKVIALRQAAYRRAKQADIACAQAKEQWQYCEHIWQNWQKRKISDLPDISLDKS